MKKIKLIMVLCISVLTLSGCGLKNKVDIPEDQNIKIVATSPVLCDILNALGYMNVVGVPETSEELPVAYRNVQSVGSPMSPDLEIIKSLNPDLVLSPQSLEDSLSQQYLKAGINSAFLDLSTVEGMYKGIVSLGNLLDCQDAAKILNDDYKLYMENLKQKQIDEKVLLIMAFPDGFYLGGTSHSYVGHLVEMAGYTNVYGTNTVTDSTGFVSLNPEDMLKQNPDKILVFAHYNEDAAFDYMKNEISTQKSWSFFNAVKNDEVYYLPSSHFGMSCTLDWDQSLVYLMELLNQ